jgi:hypothetical protein
MEQQEDEWQRYKEHEMQRKLKKKQEESTVMIGGGGASKLGGKENGKAARALKPLRGLDPTKNASNMNHKF